MIGFYLLVAHQDFAVEQDQILFILSHMKGGHTDTWAQNYQANYIDWEHRTFTHSFNKFINRLDKAFMNSNWAANA